MLAHDRAAVEPKTATDVQLGSRISATPATLRTPALLLLEDALMHNITAMADFCRRHGVQIAPHGKTTLSPEIIRRQLAAGAWGMTAANARQARLLRRWGAARVFLANQVTDPSDLVRVADLNGPDELATILVDSEDGVALIDSALTGQPVSTRLPVLIEVGMANGRAGVRDRATAVAVAKAVSRSRRVNLVGVSGFEGIIPGPNGEKRLDIVRRYLWTIGETAVALTDEGLLPDQSLLSAGGTSFFRQVTEELADKAAELRATLLLRSGCYVTSDHGVIAASLVAAGAGDDPGFRPAVQLWSRVVSRPEPGLAVLDAGRRDCPFDAGMPTVEEIVSHAGVSRPPAPECRVDHLNDQHAIVSLAAEDPLALGELVRLGPSHPCTVFDKWRVVPIVGRENTVTAIATTHF